MLFHSKTFSMYKKPHVHVHVAWGLERLLGCGRPGLNPRPRHTNSVKIWRFVLLSLTLGTNELSNRLAGLKSV